MGEWGILAWTRKQGYSYQIDLKFATSNGTNDTSKHAKFAVIGCSTFRDMTSQKFPFQKGNESWQFDIYPLQLSKTRKKSLFVPENIFSGTKLYPPLHFHCFQAKQKFICSIF